MELLKGQTAWIVGVANQRSIAWGMAEAFRANGAEVVVSCVPRSLRRVSRLAQGLGVAVVPCDVGTDEGIEKACKDAAALLGGRIGVMVHSIGFARLQDLEGEFVAVSREGWNTALDISAYSLVAMARSARRFMTEGGSIISLTFEGGRRIMPSYNIMGVAKAALESATRYLAYDLGPEKIRVNAISPGPIPTMSALVLKNFEALYEQTETHTPLLRAVCQEDVARAGLFLASDLSSAVTGEILHVDAGAHLLCQPSVAHPRAPKGRK
jgi:enoyl-[acyl-carrier protein] reductase I